jgi:hypothetical protein
MANTDIKSGLTPLYRLDGLPISNPIEVVVLSSDGTAIGVGDPLVVAGSANSTVIQGRPIGAMPTVVRATAGATNPISYVCTGVVMETQDSATYRVASTTRILQAVPADGQTVFGIQSNGTAALASVGSNADVAFTTTPNTVTGQSGAELDESTVGTGATKQLKILKIIPSVDNTIGVDGKYEALINLANLVPNTAGI